MAANLDRAETSLTAVSDIAYIRGIDGSGNSVRISKADLANVLGVKAGKNHFTNVQQNAEVVSSERYGVYVVHTSSGGSWDAIISVCYHNGNYVFIWQQETENFYAKQDPLGVLVGVSSDGKLKLTNIQNQVHDIDIICLTKI